MRQGAKDYLSHCPLFGFVALGKRPGDEPRIPKSGEPRGLAAASFRTLSIIAVLTSPSHQNPSEHRSPKARNCLFTTPSSQAKSRCRMEYEERPLRHHRGVLLFHRRTVLYLGIFTFIRASSQASCAGLLRVFRARKIAAFGRDSQHLWFRPTATRPL